MKLLRTINKLNDLAQHWRDVSTCQINMLNRHIGAMDGGFPCTEMPGVMKHVATSCATTTS